MSLMLHFRIKALSERNEPKFIVNAKLLYLTFLHGREDKCQNHWQPFQTDLMWNVFHHTGVLLDSISLVCLFSNLSSFSVFKTQFVKIEIET